MRDTPAGTRNAAAAEPAAAFRHNRRGGACALLLLALCAGLPAAAEAKSARVEAVLARIQTDRIRQDVADLAALGSRFVGHKDFDRATELVRQRLTQPGLTVTLDRFKIGELELANVVAVAPGTRTDPAIVVSAHYDAIAFPDQARTPGAEDNASGVAALLELARILSPEQLATEVRLVAFAAEEVGLHGSWQMAQGPLAIQAVINMDMVGYRPKPGPAQVVLDALEVSRSLAGRLGHAAAGYASLKVSAGLFSQGKSDHAPFASVGVPALTVAGAWNASYPHYHRATDLPDQVDPEMVAQTVRAVAAHVLLTAGFADGPPVARAGPFVAAEIGEPVRIRGDGSFDPGGQPLAHSWTQLDGPTVPFAAKAPELSFVPRQPGAYRFLLTVTAPDGRRSEPDLAAAVVDDDGCAVVPARRPSLPAPMLVLLLCLLAGRRPGSRRPRW